MENNIENRIQLIEDRNKRVELDKKWERSFARIFSISILTYIITVITFYLIKIDKPLFSGLIPTIGFILSTQSLPFIKKLWMKDK